ncbi:hypothetical protein AVEN_18691-1 [Araneus ventricosus]|uniref:Uncharacterized protein n=1 Tax=Araneus ventricosus TaxID=182803 RepID=A0A4Y2RCT1_ARAVE|nr:hypothetical protein AVEN_18691-1 [Araneus ventricosus]
MSVIFKHCASYWNANEEMVPIKCSYSFVGVVGHRLNVCLFIILRFVLIVLLIAHPRVPCDSGSPANCAMLSGNAIRGYFVGFVLSSRPSCLYIPHDSLNWLSHI